MSQKNANASKRRKSFYSFRKEYPNLFEGNTTRRPEKRSVVSAIIIAIVFIVVVLIGFFISSVILEIANKPIPENVTVYNQQGNAN